MSRGPRSAEPWAELPRGAVPDWHALTHSPDHKLLRGLPPAEPGALQLHREKGPLGSEHSKGRTSRACPGDTVSWLSPAALKGTTGSAPHRLGPALGRCMSSWPSRHCPVPASSLATWAPVREEGTAVGPGLALCRRGGRKRHDPQVQGTGVRAQWGGGSATDPSSPVMSKDAAAKDSRD